MSVNDIKSKVEEMTGSGERPRLVDIFTVDRQDGTFDLIYTFQHFGKLTDVRFVVHEEDELDSLADLYSGAVCMEREVVDMMGLRFKGIAGGFLLSENSPRTPLRKKKKEGSDG